MTNFIYRFSFPKESSLSASKVRDMDNGPRTLGSLIKKAAVRNAMTTKKSRLFGGLSSRFARGGRKDINDFALELQLQQQCNNNISTDTQTHSLRSSCQFFSPTKKLVNYIKSTSGSPGSMGFLSPPTIFHVANAMTVQYIYHCTLQSGKPLMYALAQCVSKVTYLLTVPVIKMLFPIMFYFIFYLCHLKLVMRKTA